VKKSTARMPCGCCAPELTPGETGALTSRPQTVTPEDFPHRGGRDLDPRPRRSPTIRWLPQRGFSGARRSTGDRIWRSTGAAQLDGIRPAPRTSRRCHRSSVAGVATNDRHSFAVGAGWPPQGRLDRPTSARAGRAEVAAPRARMEGRGSRLYCQRPSRPTWNRTSPRLRRRYIAAIASRSPNRQRIEQAS
jgi:hypothetical protein